MQVPSIKLSDSENLCGKFIVAHPNIADNRFAKTIIFITSHNENGAEGVVINKISAYTFSTLLSSVSNFKSIIPESLDKFKHIKVLRGGPVNNDKIFILHSNDYEGPSTIKIDNKISYTSNIDILESVIHNNTPKQLSIFIGNCTWTTSQLEDEIKHDTWIVYNNDQDMIFEGDIDKLWLNIYQSLGINNISYSYFLSNTGSKITLQ